MKISNEYLLYKKWFLICLILLLINDFYLKYTFHNAITGKLSDFAGLFIFPYFLSVFIRDVKKVYFFTALFFISWKSEMFQPIIDFSNSIGLGITRVVDYSDLIALSILPISYFYRKETQFRCKTRPLLSFLIIIISCFSFIATSLPRLIENVNKKSNLDIEVKGSIYEVENRLDIWKKDSVKYSCFVKYKKGSVFYTLFVESLNDSLVKINLDSIKSFSLRKNSFFGEPKEKLLDEFRNMKKEDFERIFLEEVNKRFK